MRKGVTGMKQIIRDKMVRGKTTKFAINLFQLKSES